MKSASGEDVFLNCISDLALNSREFDLILGKLCEDGTRVPGIVDSFNVEVQEVTDLVAQCSERKGLHEDAIKLYDLAKVSSPPSHPSLSQCCTDTQCYLTL